MQYAQIASLGLDLIGTLSATKLANSQIEAQTTLDKASAYASNLLRQGENEKKAAVTSLNTLMQSLNNQRTARAGDEAISTLMTNYMRQVDAGTMQGLSQSIAASEQIGRLTAQAAALGVGGASTAAVERTMRLQASMAEQQQEKAAGQRQFDVGQQKQQIQDNTRDSMDFRYQMAGMDYGTTQVPFRQPADMGNTLIGWLANNRQGLVNAFAGKPKGGESASAVSQPNTPVSNPQYGQAVSSNFFSINPSGVGVNWQL